jgi:general secretion pathway protein G
MRTDRFGVPINTFFDVYSMGVNGETAAPLTASQSQDDVVWANDGVYMGLASDY